MSSDCQSVADAIIAAESILPGSPVAHCGRDPRWQAIMCVGDFIPSHPDEVWNFFVKWGQYPCDDLRCALACCLLEHLLEHHFDRIFVRLRRLVMADRQWDSFADGGWPHGQARLPVNQRRIARLVAFCRRRDELSSNRNRVHLFCYSKCADYRRRLFHKSAAASNCVVRRVRRVGFQPR